MGPTILFPSLTAFILYIWMTAETVHPSPGSCSFSTTKGSTVKCPTKICRCSDKTHTATCSGHGRKLSFIPELPSYINKVSLDSDNFPWLSKAVFANLTKINLTDLSIQSSRVLHINSDAFSDFLFLVNIRLGTNVHMNVSSLKLSLASLRAGDLELLSFENMRWTSDVISIKIFEGLSGRNITQLSLSSNDIESLSEGSLDGLQGLERLYISKNRLSACDQVLHDLHSLTELDLSSNQISHCNISNIPKTVEKLLIHNNNLMSLPNFCSENFTSLLPELDYLRLDNNHIQRLDNLPFSCFPKLRYLSLTRNELQEIQSYTFYDLKNLQKLYLSDMKGRLKYIRENGFSIPSLKVLDFKQNLFDFRIPVYAKRASVGNCVNLEKLDLSHNYMPRWPKDVRNFLQRLLKLKVLRLIRVYWHFIPDGFFKLVPNVTKVLLSRNRISNLTSSLFPEHPKITDIRLDSNNIAHVGPGTFTEEFWKSIEKLDLASNPFLCDCNLLWFRDKLRRSRIVFKQYPNNYKCLSPPERKGVHLNRFNLTANDCRQKSDLLTVLISTGSAVLFLLLCMGFVYKGRWHIRYWIYLVRYRRSEHSRIIERNLKFDAFIIFADEDSDFVHNILLQKLENEYSYRMCVHTRDFQIGKIIADNIVECMSECRQVLVVLSNDFCRSMWCKYELVIAQDRWFNNESEALVLALLEDMDSRSMTKDIRALIKTTTYALWTENGLGQELFWEQLVSALKK